MESHEVVIPIFFFLCVAVIWGGHILTRHKERMGLIEKGVGADEIKSLYMRGAWKINPLSSLKWGMIFIGIGIAILVGIWLHESFMMSEGVFPGLIALFGGLGMIAFYWVARRRAE